MTLSFPFFSDKFSNELVVFVPFDLSVRCLVCCWCLPSSLFSVRAVCSQLPGWFQPSMVTVRELSSLPSPSPITLYPDHAWLAHCSTVSTTSVSFCSRICIHVPDFDESYPLAYEVEPKKKTTKPFAGKIRLLNLLTCTFRLRYYRLTLNICLFITCLRTHVYGHLYHVNKLFSALVLKNIIWLWSLVCCLMIYLHLSEFVDCSGSGLSPSIVVSNVSRHKKPLLQSPVYVLTLMSLCTLPLSPRPQHLFISVDRHVSSGRCFFSPPFNAHTSFSSILRESRLAL